MMQSPRNKFLVLLVVLLLITNLGMLLFFVILKPEHRGDGRETGKVTDFMKRELNLTDSQAATFRQLRDEHKAGSKMLFDSLRAAKNQFYNHISDPSVTDSTINTDAGEIGKWQTAIDLRLFRHFQKLRMACQDSQKPKFDTLVNKMINRPWTRRNDQDRNGKKNPN